MNHPKNRNPLAFALLTILGLASATMTLDGLLRPAWWAGCGLVILMTTALLTITYVTGQFGEALEMKPESEKNRDQAA